MLSTLRTRLHSEDGFTLATAMGLMLIASIVCLAAFQAANGDTRTSMDNAERKIAYTAAESGLDWYQSKLNANPNYWQLCDTGTTKGVADPVNQSSLALNATTRRWRTVSGTGTRVADFSLAVLPATGTTCSPSSPASVVSVDGTFSVRSTGRYRGEVRSIVAKFRRTRFLDFVYYTDIETSEPELAGRGDECRKYADQRPTSCGFIQFGGEDTVNGPFHTNDYFLTCGEAVFGRTDANDRIETSKPDYLKVCNPDPIFKTDLTRNAAPVDLPPTNATLKSVTTAGTSTTTNGYLLSGTQYIRFIGNGNMVLDVPGSGTSGGVNRNPQTVKLPPNGVIYVEGSGTCNNALPNSTSYGNATTGDSPGCPNVYVSGAADKPVTIASAGDIIVAPTLSTTSTSASNQFDPVRTSCTSGATGSPGPADLTAGTRNDTTKSLAGSTHIGLIADGYVRVYHPIARDGNNDCLASAVRDVRIDAAILSVKKSFIVDNWGRGPKAGTLQVNGAIAQKFRGPVGQGNGGTVVNGYAKDYWYDDRLFYRSPPFFLDPANTAWAEWRANELVPAQ